MDSEGLRLSMLNFAHSDASRFTESGSGLFIFTIETLKCPFLGLWLQGSHLDEVDAACRVACFTKQGREGLRLVWNAIFNAIVTTTIVSVGQSVITLCGSVWLNGVY